MIMIEQATNVNRLLIMDGYGNNIICLFLTGEAERTCVVWLWWGGGGGRGKTLEVRTGTCVDSDE